MQECYCPGTEAKFREWLKAKYGTMEALGRAWHRYSYGKWESVHAPHGTGGYPDSLDWLAFRRDDAMRLLRCTPAISTMYFQGASIALPTSRFPREIRTSL